MLTTLWKTLEKSGRKWKIIHTFAAISVKESSLTL
jgi:hypothetical protein